VPAAPDPVGGSVGATVGAGQLVVAVGTSVVEVLVEVVVLVD
jgi:hypothetical protein